MGLQIFESSGSFDPAARGLTAGDTLDVVLVGGGSSGEFYIRETNEQPIVSPRVAGTESTMGGLSSANGVRMGVGGAGNQSSSPYAGCGAGGYMPGVPMYGGNGGTNSRAGSGLAGTVLASASPWANPSGGGNKGARGFADVPAGHGYGAGGAGQGGGLHDMIYPASGGDAGKIAFGSITLANTNVISVTVGGGGVNAQSGTVSGAPGVVLVFW